MGIGLAAGGAHGFTLPLEVDHMFERARLPRARGAIVVVLCLVGIVLLDIGGALLGEAALPLRHILPELAALCAGFLAGRVAAIAARWQRAPHVDLHRA
jgi:hypothetical protein